MWKMRKGNKLGLFLIIVFIFTMVFSLPALAADDISIAIDGKKVQLDLSPMLKDQVVLVPLRAMGDTLGAEISWDEATKTAYLTAGTTVAAFKENTANATIDGQQAILRSEVVSVEGRFFVPTCVISRVFGSSVYWNSPSSTVFITNDNVPYKGFANAEAVISPIELKKMQEAGADFVLVDVRTAENYGKGHLPNAINTWRPDYEDAEHQYSGMRAGGEKLGQLFGNMGIANDTLVVIYGQSGYMDATRFWWLLDMYGHENVKVLDGGIETWRALGYSITTDVPVVTPTEYIIPEANLSKVATVEDVIAATDDANTFILDCRDEDEYLGERMGGGSLRMGRIPTAIHMNWTWNMEDGAYKTYDEYVKFFEPYDVTPDKAYIAYCQSGARSTNTTFVLSQLLGYENVQNFDGSWIEWSNREDLEIEIGQ